MTVDRNYSINVENHRPDVVRGPKARFNWYVERITDSAGHQLSGGSGASGWGYNQSNIIRFKEDVYALSWRDDLTLCVFRRIGDGSWETGPVLPPVPQNGNLLVDSSGRLHVISGDEASWHVLFDVPGRLDCWELRRRVRGDSRFGAGIDSRDRILVAGGLEHLSWYVLEGACDFACLLEGAFVHQRARGYQFVVFRDGSAHTFCSDDYFLPGEGFPNQTITVPDSSTGGVRQVETPHGIYPTVRAYYYFNADLLAQPNAWDCTVVADVSDTFDEIEGTRGTVDHQDLFVDAEGLVHLIYFENRQLSREVWAATGQDSSQSRLYHAVGSPGGPFQSWCLGAFNSGRLYQTLDGRFHYLLTCGRRGSANSIWYASGESGDWGRISDPVQLSGIGPLWHLSVSSVRSGASIEAEIDCYWTGPFGGNSNEVYFGRLTPK